MIPASQRRPRRSSQRRVGKDKEPGPFHTAQCEHDLLCTAGPSRRQVESVPNDDGYECKSKNSSEWPIFNRCVLGRRRFPADPDSQSERERCDPGETEQSGQLQIGVKVGKILQ